MTHTIYLALGSNLGNPKHNIEKAIQLLALHCQNMLYSRLYESDPMYVTDQNIFFNMALKAETDLSPLELLALCQDIEKEVGRTKTFKNGPRIIDIDILYYDDMIYQNEHLTIPHPYIFDRLFVLYPMGNIAPDRIFPQQKDKLSDIIQKLEPKLLPQQKCHPSTKILQP